MKDFNWRWLLVPCVPTVSILHVRWLTFLMEMPWPNPGSACAAVVVASFSTLLAALWASREIGE